MTSSEGLELTPERVAPAATALYELREALDADGGYVPATRGLVLGWAMHAPILRHRIERGAATLLQRLFLLGDRVGQAQLAGLVGQQSVDVLAEVGLLDLSDGTVGAQLMIIPFRELLVLADFPQQGWRDRRDPVYQPGGDSERLYEDRWPLEAERVLDLCTGSGVQGFGAAKSARHVSCVDINPRAAWAAALGSHLNRLDNVEVLTGDLTGPVTDRRFDLVLANPPFVTTPKRSVSYRDGGKHGIDPLDRLLEEVPGVLETGGFGQIITHLYRFRDHDPDLWLRERAEANGLDILVLRGAAFDSTELVVRQSLGSALDNSRYEQRVLDYLDHLDRQGFEVGWLCLICLRTGGQGRYESKAMRPTPVFASVAHELIQGFFD